MAKPHSIATPQEVAEKYQLNLKNRALAALLAWLFPGAGHLYQGRTVKGLLFMLCIVSTFMFGMYVGDGKVAFASTAPVGLKFAQERLYYLGQAGIGAVALPAIAQRQQALKGNYEGLPLIGETFRPPRGADQGPFEVTDNLGKVGMQPDEFSQWNYQLGFYFELGSIYTLIAGLLNVLVIFDAYSGPLIVKKHDEANDERSDESQEEAKKT